MGHLGNVYRELGHYEKATDILKQCLTGIEKYFGKNHEETARILLDLGQVYLAKGDLVTAEALLKKSLIIFQENKHSLRYASLESLAELSLKKFNSEINKGSTGYLQNIQTRAIDCLKQSLAIVKTSFPKDSPHIIRIQDKLKKLELHNAL